MKDLKPAAYVCRKTHGQVSRDDKRKYDPQTLLTEPCSFESRDAAAFEKHMKVVHRGGVTIALTKLPKLKPAGYTPRQTKPFEPTGLDVGATVTWKQLVETGETYVDGDSGSLREVPIREYVERSGQVWSLAYKGVWVIPFEPLENELAVKVYKDKWSTEIRHSESQYRSRRAA